MPKVVLSLKQPVKLSYFFAQGVSLYFLWETKGKAHCDPFKCLTVVAHFMFVSTCVIKSSDLTSVTNVSLIQKPNYALR